MSDLFSPLYSLKEGNWFKLICGASFQHLPAVRSLTLVYGLAGADCIDVAADPAVIASAKNALEMVEKLRELAPGREKYAKPWLMVSLNDGEDPHFRKAQFDANKCPKDCPRPCEKICPASAIANSGVIDERCYGCGRCVPICPLGLIFTRSHVSTPVAIAAWLKNLDLDGIEIHTQVGNRENFQRLWHEIAPWLDKLKVLSISCPNRPDTLDYLHSLYEIITPLSIPLIWQTDGRPMSGDLGKGTTRATIELARKVLATHLPGYVQLAGGTNNSTLSKLRALGLLKRSKTEAAIAGARNKQFAAQKFSQLEDPKSVSGIAYGSYARSLILPIIEKSEAINYSSTNYSNSLKSMSESIHNLENDPELLWQAVKKAHSLVSQLKAD